MNSKQKNDSLTFGLVKSFFKEQTKIVILYIIVISLVIPVEIFLFPKQISSIMSKLNDNNVNIFKSIKNFIPIISSLFLVMTLTLSKRYLENILIPKFTIFSRKWIFEYIIKKNQDKHDLLSIGKIMSILSELPSSARHAVIVFLRSLFPYLVGFFFLTFFFFSFDSKIGILQFVTLIIWIIISILRSKKCISVFENAQDDVINLYETIQDKFSNLISIYSSQTERKEINEHNNDENINEKKYTDSLKCVFYTEAYSNFVIFLSFVIFNILILNLYKQKKLGIQSISSLYIIEIYYWIVILRRVESNIGEFIHSIGNIKSIDKFINSFDMRDQSQKSSHKIDTRNFDYNFSTIIFKNVSFKYPESRSYILNNANFIIRNGESIWLKGHSGSGKTTIIKMILGYLKPNNGNISIFNKNILNSNTTDLRNIITYVQQDTTLFDSDIYSNIVYGNDKVSRSYIRNLLDTLNINIFDKLPNGINTLVGILGSNLSGGQKQVVLLLRAYLKKKSKIILLDEPISAVDTSSVPLILKLINHMKKNKTLIVISHNPDVVSIVDRSINISNLSMKKKND